MSDAHGVARDQLRAFIERIERLEEEKKTIADDIKDVYGEAKGTGFDTVIMKRVVSLRKKDAQQRMEEEAVLDTYLHALGMIAQPDLFEEPHHPETGEIIDPKLAQTIVTGMQTEIGRKALIAAVDIMIAREEAEEKNSPETATRSPRKAAEAVSERTATTDATIAPVLVEADKAEAVAGVSGQPETIPALTVQHDGVNVSGPERAGVTAGETATEFHAKASDDACEAGRKALGRAEASAEAPDGAELVSRGVGDRAPTATSEAMDATGGESAATSCEYCDGSGDVHRIDGEWLGFCHCEYGKRLQGASEIEIDPTEDRKEDHSLDGNADASVGGRHVTAQAHRAATAGALVQVAPATKPLRPHCRNPGERCAGYGSTHCGSCLRASREREVAA